VFRLALRRILAAALALTAAFVLACSDDPKPPATPTPVPCPVEAYICERAAEFADQLLVEQDFDWIVANYDGISFVVCNDTSGLFPNVDSALCQGTASEEERMVYEVFEGDANALFLPDTFVERLRRWVQSPASTTSDGYGDGQPRLYTIGCTLYPTRPICDYRYAEEDPFILVFSKVSRGSSERSHLVVMLSPGPDGWTISWTHIGPFDQARFLDPALKGGDILGFYGPSGQTKTFFPVTW